MPATSTSRIGIIITAETRGLERSFDRMRRNVDKSVGRVNKSLRGLQATAQSVATNVNRIFAGYLGFTGIRAIAGIAEDFSKNFAQLNAILRTNETQSTQLERSIRELGRTTVFTSSQIAASAANLARAGIQFSEIGAVLPAVLRLAQATSTPLEKSARILISALRTFNLEASESNRVIDILVRQANSANTTLEELGEALSYGGPAASPLRKELEEVVAVFGVLANQGVLASRGGIGVRNLLFNALKKFNDYPTIDIENQSIVEVLRAINEIGFTYGELSDLLEIRGAFIVNLLRNSVEELENFAQANYDAAGAAEITAKRIDESLHAAMRRVVSATEDFTKAITRDAFGVRNVTRFLDILAATVRLVSRNFRVLAVVTATVLGFFVGQRALVPALIAIGNAMKNAAALASIWTTQLIRTRSVMAATASTATLVNTSFLKAFGPGLISAGIVGLLVYLTSLKDLLDEVEGEIADLAAGFQKLGLEGETAFSDLLKIDNLADFITELRKFREDSVREFNLLRSEALETSETLVGAFRQVVGSDLRFPEGFERESSRRLRIGQGFRGTPEAPQELAATQRANITSQNLNRILQRLTNARDPDAFQSAREQLEAFAAQTERAFGFQLNERERDLLRSIDDIVGALEIGQSLLNRIEQSAEAERTASRSGLEAGRAILAGPPEIDEEPFRELKDIPLDELDTFLNEYRGLLQKAIAPEGLEAILRKNPVYDQNLQRDLRKAQAELRELLTPELEAAVTAQILASFDTENPEEKYKRIIKEADNFRKILDDSVASSFDGLSEFANNALIALRRDPEAARVIDLTRLQRANEAALELARSSIENNLAEVVERDFPKIQRLLFENQFGTDALEQVRSAGIDQYIRAAERGDISTSQLLGIDYKDLAEALSRTEIERLAEVGLVDYKIPQFWQDVTNSIYVADQALRDFIADAIVDFGSLGDSIRSLANTVIRELATIFVANPIVDIITGFLRGKTPVGIDVIRGLSKFNNAELSSLTPRHGGGRVQAGRAYLVGEGGPEPFIPDMNGTIIPSGQAGGVNVELNLTFNIDSRSDAERVQTEVLKTIPTIQEAAVQAVERRLRNPTSLRSVARGL